MTRLFSEGHRSDPGGDRGRAPPGRGLRCRGQGGHHRGSHRGGEAAGGRSRPADRDRLVRRTSAGRTLAERPELWVPSPDFESRLQARLEAWIEGIVTDIQTHGPSQTIARSRRSGRGQRDGDRRDARDVHPYRRHHRHELGVAAATAFLNQKLLAALFGEAAMAELVAHAKRRLDEALSTTFDEERARYEELLPGQGVLSDLAEPACAPPRADVRALPAPA